MILGLYIYADKKDKNSEDLYIEFETYTGEIESVEVYTTVGKCWAEIKTDSKKLSTIWVMKIARNAVDKKMQDLKNEEPEWDYEPIVQDLFDLKRRTV